MKALSRVKSATSTACQARSIAHLSTIWSDRVRTPVTLKLAVGLAQPLPPHSAVIEHRHCASTIGRSSEGRRTSFFKTLKRFSPRRFNSNSWSCDFRSVDYRSIGKFNIYLFDGPHEEADQYDGIVLAQPALTGTFFLIVDDWNWNAVRLGTFRALAASRCQLECSIEIRTTLDEFVSVHRSVSKAIGTMVILSPSYEKLAD